MILPNQKIQVFISSACGEKPEKQKYNFVREALRVLIESTGFAEVYVFESEGASTVSAGQHYTYPLEDCDVCIFLIDNSDGIPSGVQREIDTAKKHGIKSLFYFCDQTSKEETPLQKSLKGAQYAKSETVHDFKDLIKSGAEDLVSDLVMVYKHYCKRRLAWREELEAAQSVDISNIELSTYSDSIVTKDVLTNIDCCVKYLTKLILDLSYDDEEKTGVIDQLCASFLPVLFEGAALNKDSLDSLLSEIGKYQSLQQFAITKKRYEAIKDYYSGNQQACIGKLQEAVQAAKQNDLPEWLIKDILIDLRNQNAFWEESRNRIVFESEYQKELDTSKFLIYYPLLDRLSSNYYEGIIEQAIKYKIQSPGTITFGHDLGTHIKSLASIYVLAMYNGSLAHLQLLYERIKYISFYCASRYSNWSIKKLLLKTVIIGGKQKEIDGMIRCFGELLKMNEKDAYEIYSFANSKPIAHQRFITKLEAFRITSYYMDDEKFALAWSELYECISQWIEDENSIVAIGGHIFSALEWSYLRISQDQLIGIICKCIRKKKLKFYNDIFKLIHRCVNLDQSSPEYVDTLLELIINIVRNPDERNNIHNLGTALYTIRKQYRELTEELDKVIAEEMPDFYRDDYRLETTIEENEEMPEFLGKYVALVNSDNESQGKNGRYFGRGNQPHITIKNIFQQSEVDFSEDLINSAFIAACNTLLADTQTIEAKMDAIELLVYLLKSHPDTKEHNMYEVEMLLSNKGQLEKAHSVMTNLNETNLRFSALLLYNCLGENIIAGLLGVLADIGEDVSSNSKASASILNYLDADRFSIADIQLEHIFLQQAIVWSVKDNVNIRWNAVKILFSLLRNEENKNIICNQLVVLMDNDNVYIKNRILQSVHLIKDIDIETYKYIIQKATVDSNYAVRKVANEVSEDN